MKRGLQSNFTPLKNFYLKYETHGSSMSVFSVYRQLSQGRMADFPAFIASKSFDL